MKEYMYLSYDSRIRNERKDWVWQQSVEEVTSFCDSIEPCLKNLHFKLLNGITTINNRYENDVLAFEGLTTGLDTLDGNTLKVFLSFNVKNEFEGFEYVHYHSKLTRREQMELAKENKALQEKLQKYAAYKEAWLPVDERCNEEFASFITNYTWFSSMGNVRKCDIPLTDFRDSISRYSECLAGMPLSDFDTILELKVSNRQLSRPHRTYRIMRNDSLFPFSEGIVEPFISVTLNQSLDAIWSVSVPSQPELRFSRTICGPSSKEQRMSLNKRMDFAFFLETSFPFYEKGGHRCMMSDTADFREEIEDFSSRLNGEDFQPILKILGQEYTEENTGVYALTGYDCRKGIHNIDFTKVHKLIIYLDPNQILIDRVEYVCPQ
ncbi:MAG: hypothetical protein AB8B53_13530 [Flavobacteriales bacterium]